MHKDNKAEDQRGTRKRCILARKLTLAFWCRKGSLGYGCPLTRRSVDGTAHCGSTCGIGWNDSGISKPLISGCEAEGTLATPALSKVRGETGAEGRSGLWRVNRHDPI